jgi:molybdopterin adenylyltransferase
MGAGAAPPHGEPGAIAGKDAMTAWTGATEYTDMAHHNHRQQAPTSVTCMVMTISDTRTEATDVSGRYLRETLTHHGHEVLAYHLTPDEPEAIAPRLREGVETPAIQAVLCTGGTGISFRDCSYETVVRMLDKRLDGFGELFRMLSYQEIGSAAMLSRAVAGIIGETVVFSMPGSKHAVMLALEKLILPELGHLVWELRKHRA